MPPIALAAVFGFEQLVQFFGRLHPVILHLPIGVVLALAAVEACSLARRRPTDPGARRVLVWLAALSAAASAGAGWLLAREPGYGAAAVAQTIWWHRWLGVSLAGLLAAAALASCAKPKTPYAVLLLTALAVMLPAGHLGSTITHGPDFLFEPFQAAAVVERPPILNEHAAEPSPDVTEPSTASPVSFEQDILPIFERRCVSCHGEAKRRGRLSLDSAANILAGGKSGPIVVPGNPGASQLLIRLRLPSDDDAHMPPADKAQPSDDELSLIERWIKEGCVTGP